MPIYYTILHLLNLLFGKLYSIDNFKHSIKFYTISIIFNELKDQNGNSLLHIVIEDHKHSVQDDQLIIAMATALIQKNIENSKNYTGKTPLHIAAKKKDITMLKFLINNHAKIHAKDKFGCTPLHYAAKGTNKDAINVLIENNANINTKDEFGWIPLHYAIKHSNKNIINLLIKKGAIIEIKASINRRRSHISHGKVFTPLYFAIYYQNMDAFDLLIQYNANINTTSIYELTPLHFAALCDNRKLQMLVPVPYSHEGLSRKCNYTSFIHYLEQHSSSWLNVTSFGHTYQALQKLQEVPAQLVELFVNEQSM